MAAVEAGWLGRSVVRRLGRRGLVLVAAALVFGAFATAQARAATCSQSGGTVSCTFSFTGGAQSFTVPAGATSITVAASGAQGGDANISNGGGGGEAQAALAVSPGDPIEVLVGGQGGDFTRGTAGFNGGGAGGAGGAAFPGSQFSDPAPDGGGGGGASDVRTGACAATLSCGLGARVLVGGGGGGSVGAGGAFSGAGGGGGNPSGGTGVGQSSGPGIGGSQSGGGSGGAGDTFPCSGAVGGAGGTPTQGAGGAGGAGQAAQDMFSDGGEGGGGGGGGFWGGGGGGGACEDDDSAGGGGGSSFGPAGTTFTNATRGGNGVVTISYTAPTATITAPANGATYVFGQSVTSSFTCTDIAGGPGIASCLDQNGHASGTTVDTSTLGSHTFTVTATNNDGLVGAGSTSYTVNQANTSTTVTSSANSAADGQTVTFTATVTPVAPGTGTPTGTVTFLDGGSSIGTDALTGGVATLTTSALAAGNHTITTSYAGNTDFVGGTGSLTGNPQVVVAPPTISESFTPGTVPQNGASTLTFTVTNPTANTVASDGVAFTDTLPSGLVVATPNGLANTCGGTTTAVAGSGSVSLSGGTIATGSNCALSIAVNTSTPGTFVNTSAPVTSTNGGAGSTGSATLLVAAPPSAQIASPADNQVFNLGQVVATSFSCTDGVFGSGIQTCVDSGGASGGVGALDTSTPGAHTYTVTATSLDGLTGTATIHYDVAAPPSAQVITPADNHDFTLGQVVPISFSCADGMFGAGIQSCVDSNGASAGAGVLDTSTVGAHTYAVTATSLDGLTDTDTIHYTVLGPPSAQIASPADNQLFAVGQAVSTSFACAEATSGPGIRSCVDSGGASGSAGTLDTSTPGAHSYTVTATSIDGLTGTDTIHYTVAAPPSAAITSPSAGATYTKGQVVDAGYGCQDGASGPGLSTCTGPVAAGQPIDTSTPGPHTFTVTATSSDGQTVTRTVSYTVALPENTFRVSHVKTHRDGTITLDVTVPGPGAIDVLETAWNDNVARVAVLQPAKNRFVYARKHAGVTSAGTMVLRITPNARGERLVRHHTYHAVLRLWVTYTPSGGSQRSVGFYGLHLPK